MRERFDEFVKGNNLYEKLIESFLEKESFIDFIEQELKKEREEIMDIIEQINPEHGAWKDSLDGFKAVIINTIKNRT